MPKKTDWWNYQPHPRSAMTPLNEPLYDPRDGRGAYSANDMFLVREFLAAIKGERRALLSALRRIKRRSERQLKEVRGTAQRATEWGQADWPSILPVTELLGITLTERAWGGSGEAQGDIRRVLFAEWLQDAAHNHPKASGEAIAALNHWIDRGCAGKRPLSEEAQMD